jgi:carbon monoxide dehydrogenase subunit G
VKISGTYSLPIPGDRAYILLQDPALLAQCIPGCEKLDEIATNEYAMKMKMALAAVSGLFDGKVRIADQNPPSSFKLIVEGQGKIGHMKGEGAISLKSGNDSMTEVNYDGDVQVGGTIAAVGSRLVDTTAKLMIKKFFEKFSSLVSAS